MFATAAVLMVTLWAFRFMYRATGHQKDNRLPMMKLFGAPSVNWMSKYKGFWTFSAVVILAGFMFEANVDKDEYLDIEFLGCFYRPFDSDFRSKVSPHGIDSDLHIFLSFIFLYPRSPAGLCNNRNQDMHDGGVLGFHSWSKARVRDFQERHGLFVFFFSNENVFFSDLPFNFYLSKKS